MDDLISRQAAIDALGDMPMSWADTDAEIQAQEDWKQHREALLKLPTAEKKGAWMPYNDMWECSVCGNVVYSINKADLKVFNAYCGMCGARMV